MRLPAEAPKAASKDAEAATPRGLGRRRRLNILLVDDNGDLCEYLTLALERLGCRVVALASVSLALETLERERFDLLISDLELPDGNGRELVQAIQAQGGVPAIALSGHGSAEDVDLSLAAGFSVHLTKPITFPQLQSAIEQVVGSAAAVG